MVLETYHQLTGAYTLRSISHPLLSKLRIDPVINEALFESFGQMADFSIILIISLLLPSRQGMYRMMEIVHPLPVQAITALAVVRYDLDIVHIALGNKAIAFTGFLFQLIHLHPQFFEQMDGTVVHDGMNGVQA